MQTIERREFLASLAGASLATACGEAGIEPPPDPRIEARLGLGNVGFITDEYSRDLGEAIAFAQEFGITQVEIRDIWGKYAFLWDGRTLQRAKAMLDEAGIRVALLATPILKCIAPGFPPVPEVDYDIRMADAGFPIPRPEQYERAEEFLDKAIEAAKILETDKIRVFSFWRTKDPSSVRELLLENWNELAAKAENHSMSLCVENEPACNLADCAEMMAVVKTAPANFGVIWDIVNGTATGETPFPDGYSLLEKKRILHCHIKDIDLSAEGERPKIVAVGDGDMPYPQIFKALAEDGFSGALSMETHFNLNDSRQDASRRSMQGILKAIEAQGA